MFKDKWFITFPIIFCKKFNAIDKVSAFFCENKGMALHFVYSHRMFMIYMYYF